MEKFEVGQVESGWAGGMEMLPEGCGYQGYEFGAGSYPDSICCGGRLYDADNCDDAGNLYEPGEEIPCPICQEEAAISYWASRNNLGGADPKVARKNARSLVADIRINRGVSRTGAKLEGRDG